MDQDLQRETPQSTAGPLPCAAPPRGVTARTLRIVALALMFANHLGVLVTEKLWLGPGWLREFQWIVTRGAFVIFAFQLAEGLVRTKSRPRYLGRLLLFALLSEPCFDLFMSGRLWDPYYQNVLWTLLCAGAGIWAAGLIARRWPNLAPLGLLPLILTATAAELLRTDYGGTGVLIVYAFFFLREQRAAALLCVELFLVFGWWGTVEWWGFLVFPLIWFYNGEIGGRRAGESAGCPAIGESASADDAARRRRLFSYLFYPLHLLLLAAAYFLATGTLPTLN